MGLDFDVIEFCRKLRLERPPPYECPVEKCDRNYKSICGMQYHLVNYDHDNPTPQVPVVTPARKKGRNSRPANKTSDLTKSPPKEILSYAESQKFVQFEMDGKVARIAIDDAIPLIGLDEFELLKGKSSLHLDIPDSVLSLPEPSFRVLPEYNICDAPPRPNAYIRFIEKSAEELDAEVEYDLDEEDTAWLQLMNEKRAEQGLNAVSIDSMELLMDRLEKESFFQATASGQSTAPVDDDAVCCICMDGECQNTNVILFCDMCNLAVHQDCYGVPYIPEGQWLCRRCLQSPSRPVDCVLCPNTGGAFKQTDRSQWAHVVCALWIPEVRFANTVFLEPIDSIESIPPARWKLSCYICKQRGVGACIQCNRNNCYAAFHVTCAQHAGLYMRMDQVNREIEGQPVLVQKTAFCDAHTPAGALDSLNRGNKSREESRQKMKQARRLLAKKRSTVPVVSIPTIPPEKVQEIASLVSVQKKPQFIQRLIAYWTLKRHYRNGVPLLRRLQSQGSGGARSLGEGAPDTAELCKQLKYWQCLRQDLERARLLCELVRKREKIKSALTRVEERKLLIELFPLQASMGVLLQHLEAKDTSSIFCEPVDPTEVPDYSTVVTDPMDLSTMKMKLDNGLYDNVEAMEADFDLMIANCLAYNNKDTVFYKAGIKMRDQCGVVFKNAKKELKELGLIESSDTPIVSTEETGVKEIDAELLDIMNSSLNTRIPKLEKLLEKAEKLKHGLARVKRVKNIRAELKNLRKNAITDSSQSDGEGIQTLSKIIKNSPIKDTRTSPTAGVNRRTAVLFTRKAQAAFRKPNEIGQPSGGEENIETNDMQTREISNEIIPLSTNKDISTKETNNSLGKVRRGRKPKGKKNSSKNIDGLEINDKRSEKVSESFLVYRGGQDAEVSESESEVSFSESTCSSCSHATDDSCGNYSHSSEWLSSNDEDAECDPNAQTTDKPSLEPLQLVWAKCRGYPWYPALIMDPETPRGFVHNGVPLPHPPSDVLTLRDKKTPPDGEAVYLVLFFDAKRTWQWLPAGKLELLGVSKSTDQQKLVESRKPTDKKAVKKAYNDALLYQSQVTDTQGPGAIM